MLRHHILEDQRAQSFMEYTIVIGVVILILIAMQPMVKRGIQGMVKVVADEVGVQANAEQRFDDSGHLINSYTSTRATADKTTQEFLGVTNYIFGDAVVTNTLSISNLGFTNEN